MRLIFEKSYAGRGQEIFPDCDVPVITEGLCLRQTAPRLPEISENELARHYTELADQTHGLNNGAYPLGSCTMKHNPKINDQMAGLPDFTNIHPLQEPETAKGCIEVITTMEQYLCQITGMDAITLQPAAGAQAEFTGLLLMKAYHHSQKQYNRTKIIIPDSAHGTNPASAAMADFEVVTIPSDKNGMIDLEQLELVLDDQIAGLMLTNPNTLGLFDPNITAITKMVHDHGGLCYYDGANLNPVLGLVRPGDIGFDIVHLNIHKTFSTPHGGGGPGSGPCGCKRFLEEFLPGVRFREGKLTRAGNSIGDMLAFHGNFLVIVRAFTYLSTIGGQGLREVAYNAVLNANYLKAKLKSIYPVAYDQPCMHEFVVSLEQWRQDYGVRALDVAKSLLDYGIHPPTMYFPLIVHEALMFEPTETESKQRLDQMIQILTEIYDQAKADPERLKTAPHQTPIGRLDEVKAARQPQLRYVYEA